MKRFISGLLSVVITITLFAGIVPIQADAATFSAGEIQKKIENYYNIVSQGGTKTVYWNRGQSESTLKKYADQGNYAQSVSYTPCRATDKHRVGIECTSNMFSSSYQCHGFARYMCYVIFGSSPAYLPASFSDLRIGTSSDGWTTYAHTVTKAAKWPGLKTGDLVRYGGHTAVIYSVTPDGKTKVIDANHGLNRPCEVDICDLWSEWDLSKLQNSYNKGNAYICRYKGDPVQLEETSFKPTVTVSTTTADTITSNSAILRGSVSASGARATECGMYFGTSADEHGLTKLGSDSINTYGTTMYYSTDKYIQPGALTPNTTYYYQAYVIVDGESNPYRGAVKSFKTLPASTPTPTPSPSPTPTPTPTPTQDPARGIAFPTVAVGSITSTSAHVASTCSYTATRPSSVGVYLGTSTSNMTKRGSDTVNHSKNPFDIWYDLSGLTAGTTYYYKFYAIVDGAEIVSGTKSFTTSSVTSADPFSIHFSGVNASSITTNSVRLDAACSYTGTRPSSVGVYLGTSPSNMTVKGSDNGITHNKNPFDIWYNLSGLRSETTYYYRFYAIVNGTTFLSDIKTFVTDSIELDDLPNPIGSPGPGSTGSNVYDAIINANGYKIGAFDSADMNNRHRLFSLDYGDPVTVYADTELQSGSYRWVLISYNGTTGYVNVDCVQKINRVTLNTAEPYYATAKTQQVVRGDPLTGFYTNGTLKSGDTVLVNPQKQAYLIGSYTWVYVQSDSVSGYANLNLLKKAN